MDDFECFWLMRANKERAVSQTAVFDLAAAGILCRG
jgi:hypothetical protein